MRRAPANRKMAMENREVFGAFRPGKERIGKRLFHFQI